MFYDVEETVSDLYAEIDCAVDAIESYAKEKTLINQDLAVLAIGDLVGALSSILQSIGSNIEDAVQRSGDLFTCRETTPKSRHHANQ